MHQEPQIILKALFCDATVVFNTMYDTTMVRALFWYRYIFLNPTDASQHHGNNMVDVVYFLLQVKERGHHWSSINIFYCQSKHQQELALSTDPHYLSCRKIRQASSNPQIRF